MLKKIKNWLFPKFEVGEFPYSPEGFEMAKKWAKRQPHPKLPDYPRLTLWDMVKGNWIDSEYKLSEINKLKLKSDKEKLSQ